MEKNERKSNFELLRIIAMISIIMFHYSDHGCSDITYDNALAINAAFEYFSRIGGGLGNCVFMIMTGYFMSKSQFKIKKIVKIWSQVFFYSIMSYIVVCIAGKTVLSGKDLMESLMPITSNQYWYFTAYIIILFLSPGINLAFEELEKRQLLFMLIGLSWFFSIMSLFGYYQLISDNRVGVMLLLYSLGAYIRKYYEKKQSDYLWIEVTCGILLLFLLSGISIFFDKFEYLKPVFKSRFEFIWGIEKTPIIVLSTILFLVFKNLNIRLNKIINWIAASTFGVYLLHMNKWTTYIIWNDICRTKEYYKSPVMIIHVLVCVGLIYIVCTGIDKFRMYVIEYPLEKLVDSFLYNLKYRK